MARKLNDDQLQELIHDLEGTPQDIYSVVERLFDIGSLDVFDTGMWERIEDDIFLCDNCGWWVNNDNLSSCMDESICSECYEDDYDDDNDDYRLW